MKYLILLGFSVFLMACNSVGVKEDDAIVTATGETWFQLNDKKFDRFLVKSRASFANYNKINILPVRVEGMNILKSRDRDVDRSWKDVTTEDLHQYIKGFQGFAESAFKKNKQYAYTRSAGEQVLNAEFKLLEFRPYANRHGVAGTKTMVDDSVSSFGILKVQVILTDSIKGSMVAVVEDGVSLDTNSSGLTYSASGVGVDSRSRNTLANQRAAWRRALKALLADLSRDLSELNAV